MGARKRRLFLMIFAGALAALAVLFLIVKLVWPSKEYTAIQSIIENLSDYQNEIESWGYQVEVFDPLEHAPESEEDFALNHYAEGVYDPVLILTDQTGGRWYFYNGFDQYAQEFTSIELTHLTDWSEETLRIITQFQLYKDSLNRPPLEENNAKSDERAYYDVVVDMDIRGYSLETGEKMLIWEMSHSQTNYCSNNFEEHKLFNGIDSISASNDSNMYIKRRFSADRLLAFYHQGLTLQDRLMELYEHR